ncbi:uncharacterized protein CYBJADRAFT_162911 [Cyberlindnera jadinii NRRL Y-1542]|uniref:histidine kinase n=1 Tax=Cyberlindnera jadinii (strain ATCC 18201 / CBS 1600 / BCRC 20928 / JCM 3617 / NBRC 0987 / NRRL Y-1542) TaxID=983966 RepID=A0A1E4S0K9_CYBJN|nr:hypothetical protein CYBJADRAFT_162911 [Cyberlindnera jadinii NRRL Y-1542]ODV73028.1 hypothetical protein CYBJADRAFT_162911 [Cyberlindnera jadinii NRRL Y-1542]
MSPLAHPSSSGTVVAESTSSEGETNSTGFFDYLLSTAAESKSKVDGVKRINSDWYESFNFSDQNSVLSDSLKDTLPGYKLLSSISSDMYRGFNKTTKRSVIVKYVSYVSAGSISRLYNEWYALSGLNTEPYSTKAPRTLPTDIEGVLYPCDWVALDDYGGFALVYEDVLNLKTFKEVFVMGMVKNEQKILTSIIKCLKVLKIVHSYRFTHNGLTSLNLLINDNDEVYITGWDFCFSYTTEDTTRGYRTLNKRYVIDWLPYMAPEVSGEVNRYTDTRADFYSIGVILYQTLCGSLPFIASDSRELINKHIKSQPRSPTEFGLSPFLSSIIMKLLEKNAYARYQSCDHLIMDLTSVLQLGSEKPGLEPKGFIADDATFEASPKTLYGRERELQELESLYDSVEEGVHLVLVKGITGVGKTKIVSEVQAKIVSNNHYFAHWKCNTLTTGFASFIFILNNVIHQILSGSDKQIHQARDAILKVVGSLDLTPLFDSLPELKDILGPNYELMLAQHMKLNGRPAVTRPELRYRHMLKSLFIALGQSFPLTIFFDDFQWFSMPDLELLNDIRTEILKESWKSTILIFATFDTTYQETFEKFRKRLNCDFIEYEIVDTGFGPFLTYCEDIFAVRTEPILHERSNKDSNTKMEITRLAHAMFEKVDHNALRVTLLVEETKFEGLFDYKKEGFDWDLEFAKFAELPSTLFDLYARRLELFLDEEEIEMLKFAVCIHDNIAFSLLDLSVASGRSIIEVGAFLAKAVEYRLIYPMNIFYKFPFHLTEDQRPSGLCQADINDIASLALFTLRHDSLYTYMTTVYMTKDQTQEYQKTIGLRFYKYRNVDGEINQHYCLVIASHFAKSYEKISNDEEAEIYLLIMAKAQKFSYKIYDFYPALRFLYVSKFILKGRGMHQERLPSIYLEILKCMIASSDHQGAIDFIESHNLTRIDDPRIVLVTIQALAVVGRRSEGFKLAINCLEKHGVHLDNDPKSVQVQLKDMKLKNPKTVEAFDMMLTASGNTSKRSRVLQEILAELVFLAVHFGDYYFSLLAAHHLIEHSIKHGFSGFSSIGLILIAMDEITNSLLFAKELSQLALKLLKTKWVSFEFCNRVFFIYAFSIGCYLEPLKDLVKFYEFYSDAFTEFRSSFSIGFIMKTALEPWFSIVKGQNVQIAYNNLIHSTRKLDLEIDVNRYWYNSIVALLRLILNMPYDEKFDVDNDETFCLDEQSFHFKCFYFMYKSYVNKSQPKTWNEKLYVDELNKLAGWIPFNMWTVGEASKFIYKKLDGKELSVLQKRELLEETMNVLKEAKVFSPEIFTPKYKTYEAEMLKLESVSDLEILDAYQDALDSSETSSAVSAGSIVETARINERIGKWLYQGPQSKKRAANHFQQAFRQYQEAGYKMQAAILKSSYSDCFENFQLQSRKSSTRQSESGSLSPINQLLSSVLVKEEYLTDGVQSPVTGNSDALRAIEASLAISESMNTDSIIENLVTENLSILHADYAVVALKDDDSGRIDITAVGGSSFFNHIDAEESSRLVLPRNLMKECIETGTTLENYEQMKPNLKNVMKTDIYFSKTAPQSLICLPIKNEVEVLGALYLENVSIPKLFTNDKVVVAEMLCTQAAFALDKSRLYYRTMLAKKAAEEATEEKAAFLANMSHEIRTPFNSLFACAGFLLDTPLNSLQKEYVDTIVSSSKVTLNIIDAILTFSKIEHGAITLDNEYFSLNECIESSMQLIAEQASAKNLELAYFNKCEEADTIKGDVTRLKQIIINLLGNAVKFTLSGSIVIRSTANKLTKEGLYEFVISIKDSGIGIPENSHSKVFGAFSQVDGSSRRVYGGSGLGLAISKKLVELMGGEITFESEEGSGTTFFVRLTFSVAESKRKELKTIGQKILIVDRQSYSIESLKEHLENSYKSDVTVSTDSADLASLDKYYLIFIKTDFLDLIDLKSVKPQRLVIMGNYGTKFGSLDKDHPILLLPFLESKLTVIFDAANTEKKINNEQPVAVKNIPLADVMPLNILLVEDNMINTKVALQHLKKLGYTADSAIHGVQALERCAAMIEKTGSNYDVILMDIQMPLKDGIQTSRELKELYGSNGLMPIIIALTANVEREDRDRCLSCGMSNFISKPILPEVLRSALHDAGKSINP